LTWLQETFSDHPYGDPVAEVDTQDLGKSPAVRVEDKS
jgi:hypothetical protein